MPDENIHEATQEMNGENDKQNEVINEQKDEVSAAQADETSASETATEVAENKTEQQVRKPYHRNTRTARPDGQAGGGDQKDSFRQNRYRKKVCRFCMDKNITVDYKDTQVLGNFITERGKILPRRITGACAKHQRDISRAIKRARILSVLPFTVK